MWSSAWPSLEITNLKNSLKELEKLVGDTSASRGDDVDAALARFLVVRTCGYLEQVVEICCRSYLKSKAHPRCSSFGASWLGRGRSPSPESLINLVQKFDGSWAKELELLMREDDEKLKRELDFLVDRRNKIAHGVSEGITIRKSLSLVEPATAVAGWFIKTLDPK